MKKKACLLLFFFILLNNSLFTEQANESLNYQKQIAEIDKSIEMLKRWQSQYLKKYKSYQAHNKRVLFRSESTSDGRRAQAQAIEAKANALELQEQIDVLVARKEALQASQ